MGTALSGHNLAEAGLVRSGRAWETPRYAGATARFEVEVEAGASQIRVQRLASF